MKIVVVGAGNAGSLTALHFAYHTDKNVEVELIYDPTIPVQPVGQATIVDAPQFLHETIGYNWYNNNYRYRSFVGQPNSSYDQSYMNERRDLANTRSLWYSFIYRLTSI